MGNANRRLKIFVVLVLFLSVFFSLNFCYAADTPGATSPVGIKKAFDIKGGDSPLKSAAEDGVGFNRNVSFQDITAIIITSVLSIMGLLFLILAIYAGYSWMTARGNEEAVEKAKNTLTNAIIGIVIVLSAYAVSSFVLNQISTQTLNETPGTAEDE